MSHQRAVRWFVRLCVVGGIALVIAAVAPDVIGTGDRGFSRRQWMVLVAGVILALAGPLLGTRHERLRARWAATPAIGFGDCVLLGVWFGLLAGFVEVPHHALASSRVLGVLAGHDRLWMAPVTHTAIFLSLGIALGVVAWAMPWLVRLPLAVFGFVFLFVYGQSLHYPTLHLAAVLVLATALAFQAARSASRRHRGLLRLVRRSVGWLAGAVAAIAIAVPVSEHLAERSELADLPAPPASSPNVLLIVLDTVRADHVGFMGYHRDTTPNLDSFAERSVVFERAYSTSPWTLPSHGAMFTGHYPHQLTADWFVRLDDTYPTIAEVFRDRGYATGGFAGNLIYCRETNGVARGFTRYEDLRIEPVTIASSALIGKVLVRLVTGRTDLVRNDAVTVTDRFLQWLPETEGRPFFAFLNYFDAHAKYDPPPEVENRFGPRAPYLFDWSQYGQYSEEKMQGFVDAYDACLYHVDEQIGRVLEHLKSRGVLDDTLVVVVSDHGEHFGERGLVAHANSLYVPLVHSVLSVALPGKQPAGTRTQEPVSLRDLPSTILDVAGIEPPTPFPGHSLAGFWSGTAASTPSSPILFSVRQGANAPDRIPISKGHMRSLIDGWMQLIVAGDGSLELYDLGEDAAFENNLIGTERGDAEAVRLRARIEELTRDAVVPYGQR